MSGGGSEQKSLPASARKLRKAREKGQVVTSRDSIASLVTLAVLVYLFARRHHLSDLLYGLFTYTPPPELVFSAALSDLLDLAFRVIIQICLPLMILVVTLSILVGMLIAGGPLFTTEPLKPNFNKINPATGFFKIFSKRSFLTFLMHVIRVSVIFTTLVLILAYSAAALFTAPYCGLACTQEAAIAITVPLLGALVAILLLAALFDYLVQRSSFLREQKMTMTEFKRELKDQHGDPQLRSRIKGDRRDMLERPTGWGQATNIIYAAPHIAVALRYVPDEMPAPLVVGRARGAEAIARALRNSKAPRSEDAHAAAKIAAIPVGQYVTDEEQIMAIVRYLAA